MRVLALSGSLRAASINSAFCRAAVRLAPATLRIEWYSDLGGLPLFNPDLEAQPPARAAVFRRAVVGADALLIASPEYAHGISGVMKNALDWLVGYEGMVEKPVAVVNASPRARHAYDALQEVLRTMSARLVPEASVTLPLLGGAVTEEAMLAVPDIRWRIVAMLDALASALADSGRSGPSFPLG
jgi:chromate reductase, NAD(P)H dehydrogenase (quinone)